MLITGKTPGITTLIVWQLNGARLVYELTVRTSPQRLEAVRMQVAREFPDANINITMDNDTERLIEGLAAARAAWEDTASAGTERSSSTRSH